MVVFTIMSYYKYFMWLIVKNWLSVELQMAICGFGENCHSIQDCILNDNLSTDTLHLDIILDYIYESWNTFFLIQKHSVFIHISIIFVKLKIQVLYA